MSRFWRDGSTGAYFQTLRDVETFEGATAVPERPRDTDNWDPALNDGDGGWVPMPAADLLQAKRLVATLPRREFCLALFDEGVLPEAEVVLAARGEWAPSFNAFLTDPEITPRQRLEYQSEWANAENVVYAHPLLQALALMHTGGDEAARTVLLDRIFGVTS